MSLEDALRQWCDWIYLHAELASNAQPVTTWDGKRAEWIDLCGQTRERPLIEAAIEAHIWEPPA